MAVEIDKVLENCRKNLERGRAVATGIGIFAAVHKNGKILFRKRDEKDSLYGKDLSGNWELPGGGVELIDFDDTYTRVIFSCLKRELFEEAGLELIDLPQPIKMLPAWLLKNNIIDLAFVALIPWEGVQETKAFNDKLAGQDLGFFSEKKTDKLNIISPWMRFLVKTSFAHYNISQCYSL